MEDQISGYQDQNQMFLYQIKSQREMQHDEQNEKVDSLQPCADRCNPCCYTTGIVAAYAGFVSVMGLSVSKSSLPLKWNILL